MVLSAGPPNAKQTTMTDRSLTVKLLEFCEPGELLKIDRRWALVALTAQGRCLVFLTGDNAPHRVDINDRLKTTRCVSFGKDFHALPDYESECNSAPRFERGALYYATRDGRGDDTTPYLAVSATNEGKTFFLNLESFSYGEPPGHERVSFTRWGLWMKLPPYPDPVCVYNHNEE
jgi:hypothetical protein